MNGEEIGSITLDPTSSSKVFRDSRKEVTIDFPIGESELTIKSNDGCLGLDYIRLAGIEPLAKDKMQDFSHRYFRIQNCASNNYVVFDTIKESLLHEIELKPLVTSDSASLLRLNYRGLESWSICCFKEDSIDLCIETQYCRTDAGAPMSQYRYLNGNHQKWIFLPLEDGTFKIMSKDNGLYLESNMTTKVKERIVQMEYADRATQKWRLHPAGSRPVSEVDYPYGSAIAEALKVFDITNQFEWFPFKGVVPPSASSLLKGRTGNCRDESNYTVYLCRSLGIPAAVDFTPNWGNRSQGHSWSVLIDPAGKSVPFYMGCAPGDTVHYYHSYLKPKVYRHGYELNKKLKEDFEEEEFIPSLFKNQTFIDVTDEYCPTTDVVRVIPDDMRENVLAYICVFDNRDWVPVDYGRIKKGKVKFASMGRNIVYMAAVCKYGNIVPFGEPFLVKADGEVMDIRINLEKKENMTIVRKYPFMGSQDYFNIRMAGGKFQVSDKADFSSCKDIYIHDGLTNGNWYEVNIANSGKNKFFRYIGPNDSYCNINELEVYSKEGKKLSGEIIGTEGVIGKKKEMAFDGDILTGFEGVSPDGHWIGLKFKTPVSIGKIRYIPRNDGNCIEKGDKYLLMYWHDNRWNSLGEQIADGDSLIYDDVPVDGLYVVRNLTKGHEERIFTYENGEQVWW